MAFESTRTLIAGPVHCVWLCAGRGRRVPPAKMRQEAVAHADEIFGRSNGRRIAERIYTPAAWLGRPHHLWLQQVVNLPDNSRPSAIRCDHKGVAVVAARWIDKLRYRAKRPTVDLCSVDDGKAVIDGRVFRTSEKRRQLGRGRFRARIKTKWFAIDVRHEAHSSDSIDPRATQHGGAFCLICRVTRWSITARRRLEQNIAAGKDGPAGGYHIFTGC
jgi:hypothetical protein